MRRSALIAAAALFSLSGCAAYYRVEDQSTAALYYTKDIHHAGHGTIRFRDEASQSVVTLQNAKVSDVPVDVFRRATGED